MALTDIFENIRHQQYHWDYSMDEFDNTQHLDSIYYAHIEAIQIALHLSDSV